MKIRSSGKHKKISGRHIFAVLIAVFVIVGGYAGYRLIVTEVEYSAAQNEYSQLRVFAPELVSPESPAVNDNTTDSPKPDPDESADAPEPILDPVLSEMNPDFIGWIRIDGTDIDYPVVQGIDNITYLSTTFTRERNPSGTIFMDFENNTGFNSFAILHGHNMRDGSMFAGLHNFLDDNFRTDYNEVTIFSQENGILQYKIFAVKQTDIHDAVFNLPVQGQSEKEAYFSVFGFTAEELRESTDILVLATCTRGAKSERLLVMAAHVRG